MRDISNFMKNEEWRKVPNFPAYSVSNFGNVRRDAKGGGAVVGRILKFNPTLSGYLMVHLWKDKKPHPRLVHRLVAEAFIPRESEERKEIAHYDGNRSNNRVDNLRWATRSENMQDTKRHGTSVTGSKNPMSKLDESKVKDIKNRLRQGESISCVAGEYSVNRATIEFIKNGKTWKHVA